MSPRARRFLKNLRFVAIIYACIAVIAGAVLAGPKVVGTLAVIVFVVGPIYECWVESGKQRD